MCCTGLGFMGGRGALGLELGHNIIFVIILGRKMLKPDITLMEKTPMP